MGGWVGTSRVNGKTAPAVAVAVGSRSMDRPLSGSFLAEIFAASLFPPIAMSSAPRFLVGALFLNITSGTSQVLQTTPLPLEVTIQAIRKHYQTVQTQLPQLRKITVDTNGTSTDGGEITAYFQGKQLVFATQQLYGETGQQQIDYLFSQQRVTFIVQRQQQYNAPYYVADFDVHKSRIYETRYYFSGGQLIRRLDAKGQLIPTTTPAYLPAQQQLLFEARQLQQLIRLSSGHQ